MHEIFTGDKDFELYVLLTQTHDTIIRLREKELRKAKISQIQAAVLYIIQNNKGPVTPAVLSKWLLRKPHSVSALLKGMEKQGLVRKTRDLDKKNLFGVIVGKALYEGAIDLKEAISICLRRE